MLELVLPNTMAERRFTLLLASLTVLLVVAPLFGETARGDKELALLFSVVVIGMVIASKRSRSFATLLAVLWIGLTWSEIGHEIASDLVLLALCVCAIDSVLSHALAAERVDGEVLAGAISAYVLMGICWAVVFTLLETNIPGSLHLSSDSSGDPWHTVLYFSFATLTTLGYGDVAPVSLTARAWATLEAMGGTLYMAMLIARLVSLYKAPPKATGP